MLINASKFLETLGGMHDCAITGRKGSGKTLLSIVLADEMLRKRHISGVWANFPHSLPRSQSLANSLVILDEAAQFFDARWSSMQYDLYSMWARKSNSVYLYPSVNAVDKRVRNLEVLRVFAIDLLPRQLWIYHWQSTYKEKGYFLLYNPEKYFGLYDTKFVPTGDGGTLEAIVSMYPEAVWEIIEARQGNRLQKLVEKYLPRENVSGSRRSGGSQSFSSGVSRAEFDELKREVARLRGMVANVGSRSAGEIESDSVGGFRN